MSGQVTFRPVVPDDLPFLREVYASARAEELAPVPWSDAQKAAFLRSQFAAQHQHYQGQFPLADFLIILRDGVALGRLYLARSADEFRLIDLTLLPPYRKSGLGTALLTQILTEATQAGKPVRLHVERFNPALRLYQRLGFVVTVESPIYLQMERPAGDVVLGAKEKSDAC